MTSLPTGTYQPASASYIDAGDEIGNMRVNGKVITAGNAVAQATAWTAVLDAVDDLSLGHRSRDTYDNTSRYSKTVPTNGAAREICLKARFIDATTGSEWLETVVPCLNGALITYVPGGKDVVDMTTTEIAALKTALEAFPVVNPWAQANVVTVKAMYVQRGQK